jgi:GT2 family glycosyltransferase
MSLGVPSPGAARVGVVIVHWNQPDRCRRTIEAFEAQTVPVDLVVVDNGSRAGVLAELRAFRPALGIRELGGNRGFGPAANVGLRDLLESTDVDYLIVAPHDALPAPDCVERLFAELESRPNAGLVCADVGDGVTPYINPYLGGIGLPARIAEGWEPADYVHGTLLMARRRCLEEIGLFDERFFAYGEEVEIGARARAARWEVGLLRGARVVNPTSRLGTNAVDYLMERNNLLLVRELSGRTHALTRLAIALVGLARGWLNPSRRPALFSPRARLRGFVDYARGRYGAPPAEYFEKLDERGEPIRAGSEAVLRSGTGSRELGTGS